MAGFDWSPFKTFGDQLAFTWLVSATTIPVRKRRGPKNFFDSLGPGLITGADDDDPSGISTYSVAGATFGYATLWTALITFPLMTAVHLMCARLGLVTGRGLAHGIRLRYSCWVLWGACALLAAANITNLGADLGGMAEVSGMMLGVEPSSSDTGIRGADRWFAVLVILQAHRANLQMAYFGALRLCSGRVPR